MVLATEQVTCRQECLKGLNIHKDVTPSPHSSVETLWISLLEEL